MIVKSWRRISYSESEKYIFIFMVWWRLEICFKIRMKLVKTLLIVLLVFFVFNYYCKSATFKESIWFSSLKRFYSIFCIISKTCIVKNSESVFKFILHSIICVFLWLIRTIFKVFNLRRWNRGHYFYRFIILTLFFILNLNKIKKNNLFLSLFVEIKLNCMFYSINSYYNIIVFNTILCKINIIILTLNIRRRRSIF